MNHPTYSDEKLVELTKVVGELAVACGQHDLALSALLRAYYTVAKAHPCCLQECANVTFRMAMMLASSAAEMAGSTHIH